MPRPSPTSRLLRAALDPGLLVWSVLQGATWPFRELKFKLRSRQRQTTSPRWALEAHDPRILDPDRAAEFRARPGPHLAMTGLGYGEFVMLKRMIDGLRAVRPDVKVSVALRHTEAIEYVLERHPDLNVSFWPQDGYFAVLRWLASQKPDMVTLIEGYRQPVLVVGAARYGARVALLNGRLRDRSSFHSPILGISHRWIFRAYAALAMRQTSSAEAVRSLVSPDCDLLVSGDIKTDFSPPDLPAAQRADLESWLASDLPLVAAGSTDNLEEERMVVAAFAQTRAHIPCRLLLAPRQPSFADGLPEALEEAGLTFARRSEGPHGDVDVLILDSQGELANAYGACVAAYVGGSYNPRGNGHNPIEPLAWGVPVAYGMQRGHFEAIQLLVEEAGVGTRLPDAAALSAFWLRFLGDPAERERAEAAGKRLVAANRGAVERTVAMLMRLLPPAT